MSLTRSLGVQPRRGRPAEVSLEEPSPPSAAASGDGSRLGAVLSLVAAGLIVQASGDMLCRAGHGAIGLGLFFAGVAVVFASCAWRLLGTGAGRQERLAVSLALGLGLVVSAWLASPLLYSAYDELLHETTLWQLIDLRRLFSSNSVLPVSPSYPGLELLTVAVRWLTGLPSDASQLVVVSLSRLVLVAVLFLFAERVTRSARAAGLAVLVYALSPQFWSFNAAYSYQTLALALGAATLWLLLVAVDSARLTRRRLYAGLAVAASAGTTVTHHLVGWLTVSLLVVWAIAASLDGRRDELARVRARTIWRVALPSLAISVAWTAAMAPRVFPYLAPTFTDAWRALVHLVGGAGGHRVLFHSATGVTPLWQQALVVLSVLVSIGLVVAGLWQVVLRRGLPGRAERLLPAVISLGYLAVLASPLEGAASQVGQRGSTFVYLGIALIAAAWLVRRRRPRRPRAALSVAVVLATGAFLGGLVFGSGASWSYVPGPYIAAADQRSVDGPSIAAATWAAAHLPVGARVAADRDNAVLMAAVGHLSPVTEVAGEANVGFMYFDPNFGNYEKGLIRRLDIRYLVVDQRLASGPPAYGVYFEPGAPGPGVPNRLTTEELDKFASVRGLRRVYDNGPIQIYDTAGLLGTRKPATALGPIGRPNSGTNLPVLVPAAVVAAAWLALAWRRRRRRAWPERALAGLVAAMVGGIGLMFAYVPSGLPPDPLAWGVLGVLFAWCAWSWRSARTAEPATAAGQGARPAVRAGGTTGRAGGAEWALGILGVVGVALAIGLAIGSDRSAWAAQTALSVSSRSARPAVAEVSLASGARHGDRLEVVTGRRVLWSRSLAPAQVQQVELPPAATRSRAQVVLLVDRHEAAKVAG